MLQSHGLPLQFQDRQVRRYTGTEHALPGIGGPVAGQLQRHRTRLLARPGCCLRHARDLAQRQDRLLRRVTLDHQLQPGRAGQLPLQLRGRALGHHASVMDNEDLIAQLLDLRQDMGAENHGVLPGQVANQIANL